MIFDVEFRIAPRIRMAIERGTPVVALESTVITHGLPRPRNLELAAELEATVRQEGAEPATIALLDGVPTVGLEPDDVERLDAVGAEKASLWNLAALVAQKRTAGTTVATTLHAAAHAGIGVFATGGIGGVHDTPFDESADLQALARYPVVTVCAGPKSVLDVPATVERLETLGVPVVAYRSNDIAGFHAASSGLPAPARADDPAALAEIVRAHRRLGLPGGVLVTHPVSSGVDSDTLRAWVERAKRDAASEGLRGKDATPYLLARLAEISDGRTVDVNIRLLRENARLAACVAHALATNPTTPGVLR